MDAVGSDLVVIYFVLRILGVCMSRVLCGLGWVLVGCLVCGFGFVGVVVLLLICLVGFVDLGLR